MPKWLLISLFASFAYAEAPKIDTGGIPTETSQADAIAPSSEPISVTTPDPSNKEWQEYSNRIVKARVRVKTAWTVIEIKETKDSGSANFRLSPNPYVSFSMTREPMTGPFEEYMSSSTLTSIYPSGFKKSKSTLAGRPAVLVKGLAEDGRMDESYFVPDGQFYTQVSFSSPQEFWKNTDSSFAALKQSFHWLP